MHVPKNRLRLLSFLILVGAVTLVTKLYMVQIVSGKQYEASAENQYIGESNFFDRGSIFFTNKDGDLVPAASIKTGYTLFINPNILHARQDLTSIYEKINAVTPIDRENFFTKAKKADDPYEEISKRLEENVAEKIRSLKIKGVSVVQERWRIYPGREMAAHTVGFMGYIGDDYGARYGLERYYDQILARSGENVFVNFFAEIFSNIKSVVQDGLEGDIVTTIEPTVQAYLESELEKITGRYSSDFSGGIIIDPKNGEIYALALAPTFDPNTPQSASDASVFRNRLVEDRYEMGSILKAVTVAIGLDAGAITAKTTFNDPGCQTLNTKKFCNYDGKSHGTNVSMQTVLNKSLNTGAAYIALRMGSKNFSERMLAFDLDKTTDIDLPSEGNSLVSNLKTGRDLEAAQASFGQGIALTPINTVRALSALANGGTLISPHIVKEIRYDVGAIKNVSYPTEEERVRVLSPEASSEVSRMLTEVVDRSLRDGTVRLEQYNVAAKTGTAQIARPDRAGYYDDRYLHSFFGYFPAYKPEFLVFLYTYYPKGVQYASETLTDTFINTTKFLINYYNIPPDREAAPRASL